MMTGMDRLNNDVMGHIFGFDATFHDYFLGRLLPDLEWHVRGVEGKMDRGYSVRNWMEGGWAVIPRYIMGDRAYGSYLRGGRRVTSDL